MHIYNFLEKNIFFFEGLRMSWVLYNILYFSFIKIFNVFFISSKSMLDSNSYSLSYYFQFFFIKNKVSYDFFLKDTLIIDLAQGYSLLDYKRFYLSGFYLISLTRLIDLISIKNLKSESQSVFQPFFSFEPFHFDEITVVSFVDREIKSKNRPGESGSYLLKKRLYFENKILSDIVSLKNEKWHQVWDTLKIYSTKRQFVKFWYDSWADQINSRRSKFFKKKIRRKNVLLAIKKKRNYLESSDSLFLRKYTLNSFFKWLRRNFGVYWLNSKSWHRTIKIIGSRFYRRNIELKTVGIRAYKYGKLNRQQYLGNFFIKKNVLEYSAFFESFNNNVSYSHPVFIYNESRRNILLHLNLILDRVTFQKFEWSFIFRKNNPIKPLHHIFSYFNEYWIFRSLIESDLRVWEHYIKTIDFRFSSDTLNVEKHGYSQDIYELLPSINTAFGQIFSKYQSILIAKAINDYSVERSFWVMSWHLINVLQNVFKKRVCVSAQKGSSLYLEDPSMYEILHKALKDQNLLFQRIYVRNEFLDVLVNLCLTKDPKIFTEWLARTIRGTSIKKHNKFINYVKSSINSVFSHLAGTFGLVGLKIRFKGKINDTGSFRKKTKKIIFGSLKKADISFCGDKSFAISVNLTGVIGVIVEVAY